MSREAREFLVSTCTSTTYVGELGNAYIREHTDYKTMDRLTIMKIQGDGQQIWYNNVFRDLDNGGPVKPPIEAPYPKYAKGGR